MSIQESSHKKLFFYPKKIFYNSASKVANDDSRYSQVSFTKVILLSQTLSNSEMAIAKDHYLSLQYFMYRICSNKCHGIYFFRAIKNRVFT